MIEVSTTTAGLVAVALAVTVIVSTLWVLTDLDV